MGAAKQQGSELAPLTGRPNRAQRTITRELAQRLAEILLSDPTHNIQSASDHVGLRARTVHEAIRRYTLGKCATDEDEEICGILASAKEQHIHQLRKMGFAAAGKGNGSACAFIKWQLEVQDPRNHPRGGDAKSDEADDEARSLKEMSIEQLQQLIRGKQQAEPEAVIDTEAEEQKT